MKKRSTAPFRCQECGAAVRGRTCPKCRSTDIDVDHLAPARGAARTRYTARQPREVWRSDDGWEWRVIGAWKPAARPIALCFVSSPYHPIGEYGDVALAQIASGNGGFHAAGRRVWAAADGSAAPPAVQAGAAP